MTLPSTPEWHTLSAAEAQKHLGVDFRFGLDDAEVRRRAELYGPNALPQGKRTTALVRFLRQFNNALIIILLIGAAITTALGDITDASVILGVVLLNALIGFLQEGKAVAALEALSSTVRGETTVLRAGKRRRISITDVVPGDIVLLEAGDRVPADARILRVKDCTVAEAALTGESVPVTKHVDMLPPDTVVADRTNMVFASTVVTAGAATVIVTATGASTEVGAISALLDEPVSLQTPLTRTIERFSKLILYGILVLAGLTAGIGLLRGQSALDVVLASVALAVGAIPEGLPAAVTIILAIGVSRMAKRKAIIRRLAAVETLGSTSVICSDKTGTLTQNAMTVVSIDTIDKQYDVTGTGYSIAGNIYDGEQPARIGADMALRELLRAGLLCSTANVVHNQDITDVVGDPTEIALVLAAMKAGMTREIESDRYPLVDMLPFSSELKYMASLHVHDADEERIIFMKGAVESVVPRCMGRLRADGETVPFDHNEVYERTADLSERGLRVLGIAVHRTSEQTTLSHDHLGNEFLFCGLVAIVDPPREEAREAIVTCHEAGVDVRMITGDHASTASTIADQLGLRGVRDDRGRLRAVTGSEIATMSAEELTAAVESTAVFARVSPEQKLRLVEALQAKGHIVAMTGDGVNDAPALRHADIGVAMGVTGTDVAKDAADMVLTDDNFATIVAAVEEGRTVFENLLKFIVWTIPTNLAEGLVIVVAIALGVELPILPAQILWINMTTAVILGLPLAFEPTPRGIMLRKPRDTRRPLLSRDLVMRTAFVGSILTLGTFGVYLFEINSGSHIAGARTAASNALVIMEAFYLLNCRSLVDPVRSIGWFSNMWVWGGITLMVVLQILFTYVPFMHVAFHTAPILPTSWTIVTISGIALFILVGAEKKLRASSRPGT